MPCGRGAYLGSRLQQLECAALQGSAAAWVSWTTSSSSEIRPCCGWMWPTQAKTILCVRGSSRASMSCKHATLRHTGLAAHGRRHSAILARIHVGAHMCTSAYIHAQLQARILVRTDVAKVYKHARLPVPHLPFIPKSLHKALPRSSPPCALRRASQWRQPSLPPLHPTTPRHHAPRDRRYSRSGSPQRNQGSTSPHRGSSPARVMSPPRAAPRPALPAAASPAMAPPPIPASAPVGAPRPPPALATSSQLSRAQQGACACVGCVAALGGSTGRQARAAPRRLRLGGCSGWLFPRWCFPQVAAPGWLLWMAFPLG